jgi:NAD(P)-dependent dehydrogenase (short-subunit alcohol dehydrogenase family)
MTRRGLDGLTALVTGAGRGIGRACALLLAERGAHVITISRTGGELDMLCGEIGAAGGSAEARPADVTDLDTVRLIIEGLERLDILVNNAGTNIPQPFIDIEEETLDKVMTINFRSAFLVAQAAARKMIPQRTGSIIHMSSQMGHVGGAKRTVYCASKHAIEGLTKAMAVELGPLGVRVNTVAPTFVETPMTKPFLQDEAFRAEVYASIPLGCVATTEDIAEAVCFLASPASKMINGHSLLVDGGWTAR